MADNYSPAAGAFPAVNEGRMGTGQDSEKKSFYLRRFCKVERFGVSPKTQLQAYSLKHIIS